MKINLNFKKFCVPVLIFSLFYPCFSQKDTAGLYNPNGMRSSDESFAAEEFRRGIQSFYRGSYNDSVFCFEKALTYLPEDNLILTWLGKSYYRSGLEANALEAWTQAEESGYGGLLLKNMIQVVKERRVAAYSGNLVKLTESGNYSGQAGENFIFASPMSILAENDGSFWVIAYNSNELLKINANGIVITRSKGPVNGFDRPLDLIRLKNGNLLVSEVKGNRLSLLSPEGKFIKHFGSKGIKSGEFSGPQYLAEDFRGNIFVSDYGNKRIQVLNQEGEGIFSFGEKQDFFHGLKAPTGIAIIGESVFVADEFYGCIYEFDLSGNFIKNILEEKTLSKPEALKIWNDYLVVCDSNKVYSVNPFNGYLFENVSSGNAPSKLVCAVPDVNGNLLVSDYRSNEIYVMSRMEDVIGGYFVQIEKVNADKFPNVSIDIKVENVKGNPVVGLDESNFIISEQKRSASNIRFLGASSNNKSADVTVLIDRNILNKEYESQIDSVVRQIAESMKNRGTLRIVSAGQVPVLEYRGEPEGALKFSTKGLKSFYSKTVPLDLALRLCINDLIPHEKKRAVIFITSGKTSLNAFDKYSLNEMCSYMKNNSVIFSTVLLSKNSADESLDYLSQSTYGNQYYIYRTEGLSSIINDIISVPSGLYSFSYTSSLSTNFGEKYLPVEVEVYLMNKSGRDESGYFAPFE